MLRNTLVTQCEKCKRTTTALFADGRYSTLQGWAEIKVGDKDGWELQHYCPECWIGLRLACAVKHIAINVEEAVPASNSAE